MGDGSVAVWMSLEIKFDGTVYLFIILKFHLISTEIDLQFPMNSETTRTTNPLPGYTPGNPNVISNENGQVTSRKSLIT